MSVGRWINQPRRSRGEKLANDIIASVCQTVTIVRSFQVMLGRANQHKWVMLRRRFCCITRTIIFSVRVHILDWTLLSGVNVGTIKKILRRKNNWKKSENMANLTFSWLQLSTRGNWGFREEDVDGYKSGRPLLGLIGPLLKTLINVNKINDSRSSVLFTKVDYCASAKKENELSQVTKLS